MRTGPTPALQACITGLELTASMSLGALQHCPVPTTACGGLSCKQAGVHLP